MQNIQLLGIQNAEKFNFRTTLIVVVLFCIITIVSYFNELAKAGLLSGDHVKYGRDIAQRRDNIFLHKDGNIHQLDLNLEPLREMLHNNSSDPSGKEQNINIAVHLGKNESYSSDNDSIRIYKFENVIPNFYLTLNRTIFEQLPLHDSSLTNSEAVLQVVQNLQFQVSQMLRKHHNSTTVLMYQHDLGGYLTRDCFISEAMRKGLVTSNVPLNSVYRTEWESMPFSKKSKFEFLYGALSFGVCEGMDHSCTYANMIAHPIDRAMQVYHLCRLNASLPLCKVNKVNESDDSIEKFIERQGNVLFQKLLYYSRHCKLVGRDEVCIHDTQTFFLLSRREKLAYLEDILSNLENWFSVIGLVKHFKDSMMLYQYVMGGNLTSCSSKAKAMPFFNTKVTVDGMPYANLREQLLNNSQVVKALGYDLAIYAKLENIFSQQLKILDLLQTMSLQPVTEPAKALSTQATRTLAKSVQKKMRRMERARKKRLDTDIYLKVGGPQTNRSATLNIQVPVIVQN